MSSHTDQIDDYCESDATSPVWALLIATSSILVGYLVGRISYRRDLDTAVRRIEESSEPIEVSIRTL